MDLTAHRYRLGRTARVAAMLGACAAIALPVAGCGGDDGGGSGTTTTQARANGVDRAFVAQMVPHHEMAVEMAVLAPDRAKRPELQSLARTIVDEQQTEIAQMQAAAKRIGAKVSSHGGGHGGHGGGAMAQDARALGVRMDDMGMTMDLDDLKDARSFDRAFIDEMIPHHQGAIVMARAELARGADPELRDLATAIVDAQTKEIKQMNTWRTQWFGKPSPAGGVPKT